MHACGGYLSHRAHKCHDMGNLRCRIVIYLSRSICYNVLTQATLNVTGCDLGYVICCNYSDLGT